MVTLIAGMPDVSIKLTGRDGSTLWLSDVTSVASVRYSEHRGVAGEAGGGFWDASWSMPDLGDSFRHRALVRGSTVEIYVGAHKVWDGLLSEPDPGSWSCAATGVAREAYRYAAVTASGVSTRCSTVISYAATLGLPWLLPSSGLLPFMTTAYVPESGNAKIPMLSNLLEATHASNGAYWWIDEHRIFRQAPIETAAEITPRWHVSPSAGSPGVTDDNYVTDIYATFAYGTATAPVTATARVSDESMATKFGRRSALVDLTPLGPLASTDANARSIATSDIRSRLKRAQARTAFTAALAPSWFELTNAGDVPAAPWLVRAGDWMRVHGLYGSDIGVDASLSTDVMIQAVEVDIDAGTVRLAPHGLVARDLGSILADAIAPEPAPLVGEVIDISPALNA